MANITEGTFFSNLYFFSLTGSDDEVGDENFHEKLFSYNKNVSNQKASSEVGDENFHKRLFPHEKTHIFYAETALENIIFHMDMGK